MAVCEQWARIEQWLLGHARYVLDSLNPGASVEAIRTAGAATGVKDLPDDFVQSWLIHDGQRWDNRPQLMAGAVGSYALMPLQQIVSHWQTWTDLLGDFDQSRATPRGPVQPGWWSRRWLPIGVNGVGDLVCLDLDPAPGGTVGQVIEVLHEDGDRTVLSASLGEWLGKFARDLEIEMYDATHDRFYGLVHVRDL